ncbi:hypothetical protein LBMAG56_19230 [Verrucomicrobiota bacterium]|nr:hypothetical protein LBMAG56_19230 [Verrucomicrobiota bacterium]
MIPIIRWLRGLWLRRTVGGASGQFFNHLQWQYVTTGSSLVFGFSYTILLGRWLGAGDFGLLAVAMGFSAVIFQFVDLRLNEAVVKYVHEYHAAGEMERCAAAVRLSLLANGLSACLALGLLLLLARVGPPVLLNDSRGLAILGWCGLSSFLTSVGSATAMGLIRMFGLFREQAILSLGVQGGKLALTAAAILWWHFDLVGVAILAAALSAVNNLLFLWMTLRHFRAKVSARLWRAPFSLLQDQIGDMRKFVRNTYLFSVMSIPTKELDVTFLGWFADAATIGHYRVAKSFMSAIWAATDPAFYVVYPELVKFWVDRNLMEMQKFIHQITWIFGVSGVVLVGLAAVVVPPIMQLAAGSEFAASRAYFLGMLWGILFWLPLLWANPLLLAIGRSDLAVKGAAVGAGISLLLYCGLVPLFGGIGAALSNALGGVCSSLVGFWMVRSSDLLSKVKSNAVVPAQVHEEGHS